MQKNEEGHFHKRMNYYGGGHGGNAVYVLGLIGAIIYFIQRASTLQQGIIGILKAIVWPALLVYKALELLKF